MGNIPSYIVIECKIKQKIDKLYQQALFFHLQGLRLVPVPYPSSSSSYTLSPINTININKNPINGHNKAINAESIEFPNIASNIYPKKTNLQFEATS